MSTDVNKFDSCLKKNLGRDLLFRSVLWSLVSAATAYVAVTAGGLTPLQHFERVGTTLAPVVNALGAIGLLFGVVALLLKDIEKTTKRDDVKKLVSGYAGGFVRRAAGDITLWTLGVLTTLLASFLIALWYTPMSARESAGVLSLLFLLFSMTILTAVVNVLVRREGATPLVRDATEAKHVLFFWLCLAVAIVAVWCLG